SDSVPCADPVPTVGSFRVSGAGMADSCRLTICLGGMLGDRDSGRAGTDCTGWTEEAELCCLGKTYSGWVPVFCVESALPQDPQKRACDGQAAPHCKQETWSGAIFIAKHLLYIRQKIS